MQANVKGTTMPVLEMVLEPGEAIISTHGDLSWMSANMQLSQTANTGGGGGIMAGLKRMAGGGGLLLTRYEATGGPGMVSFASKLPGRIFPIDVSPGHGYVVHRHGWVCGTPGDHPFGGASAVLPRRPVGWRGLRPAEARGRGHRPGSSSPVS